MSGYICSFILSLDYYFFHPSLFSVIDSTVPCVTYIKWWDIVRFPVTRIFLKDLIHESILLFPKKNCWWIWHVFCFILLISLAPMRLKMKKENDRVLNSCTTLWYLKIKHNNTQIPCCNACPDQVHTNQFIYLYSLFVVSLSLYLPIIPCVLRSNSLNILWPKQNGRHFPNDIFKCIFLNENVSISIQISLKFVP